MMEVEQMSIYGVTELANAIIIKAVSDLTKSLKYIRKHKGANTRKYSMHYNRSKELERFFHGQWIKLLTNLDGPMLYKKIIKMLEGETTMNNLEIPRVSRGTHTTFDAVKMAKKLKKCRGERPARVVSEATGVSERMIWMYEAADVVPSLPSLMALAAFYSVDLEWLCFDRYPSIKSAAM